VKDVPILSQGLPAVIVEGLPAIRLKGLSAFLLAGCFRKKWLIGEKCKPFMIRDADGVIRACP